MNDSKTKLDLTETRIEGETAYQGKFLALQRDTVRLPDGKTTYREFLRHPGAVAVLALTADGELILERQFRYPAGLEFIEVPAGKIDPQEPPLETGKRELFEETGFRAAKWHFLGTAYPCIGYSDEQIHYYVAEELTSDQRQLDEGEFLEVTTVPLDEVRQMALDGRINDSKTLTGLYWLDAYLGGQLTGEAV